MQLLLTNEDVLTILYCAFCDGGISQLQSYGLKLTYKDEDYIRAKEKLEKPNYEDVLTQILRDGNTITFVDTEGSESDAYLTLEKASTEFAKPEALRVSYMILTEDYDAYECDMALQLALFGKEIYR